MVIRRNPPVLFLAYCFFLSFAICEEENEGKTVDQPKLQFQVPKVPSGAYLALYFDSPSDLDSKLVFSEAKKEGADEAIAKYDGIWAVEVPKTSAIEGDYALVLKSAAKHHAISSKLLHPIKFDTDELVIQYEVNFQNGMDCGGAYIKLLSDMPDLGLKDFADKTPYTIMFGPDKCATNNKFHFIFRHENPLTGAFEEKHATKPSLDMEHYFTDKKTHLYTLVLRSDNTFERYVDQFLAQSGSLLKDFEPQVNPTKEIDDPDDHKPEDWDERETIPDESATKPEDWNEDLPEFIIDENAKKPEGWLDAEQELIPDPKAEMPQDWDPDMDGEWEPPKIRNPKCDDAPGCGEWKKPTIRNPNHKGKWVPPRIPNPNYKGAWAPRRIPNPHYFEDNEPYRRMKQVAAVGFELWSMSDEIAFDNILIVDSKQAADEFAKETWLIKRNAERRADPRAQSVVDAVREAYQERPWIFAVVGLVCTLPIFLCCVYFCRSSPAAKTAHHKKTDAPTPDDPKRSVESSDEGDADADVEEEDEGELLETDLKTGSGDRSSSKSPTRKADLESESDGADGRTVATEKEKQTARKRRSRKE